MLQLEHIAKLVDLAYPPETLLDQLIEGFRDIFRPQERKHRLLRQHERQRLIASIKPVKFGYSLNWASASTVYNPARYDIPRAIYLIILRVEAYTVNLTSGATDYGLFEPPPTGFAYWFTGPYGVADATSAGAEIITDQNAPTHLVMDTDEYLIVQGGQTIALNGNWSATADAASRAVHTLVYAYEVTGEVIERIAAQTAVISTNPH